jgi:hypothetical protein
VLVFHVQNEVLDLRRKLIGVSIRASTAIGEPMNAAFLVAIEDLVAGFAGDPELPAKFRHWLAG